MEITKSEMLQMRRRTAEIRMGETQDEAPEGLSADVVAVISDLAAEGHSKRELADTYGISVATVRRIARGEALDLAA